VDHDPDNHDTCKQEVEKEGHQQEVGPRRQGPGGGSKEAGTRRQGLGGRY